MKGLDSAFIRWNDTHYAWEWVIYDEDGFDGRDYFAEADHNASDEELYLLFHKRIVGVPRKGVKIIREKSHE